MMVAVSAMAVAMESDCDALSATGWGPQLGWNQSLGPTWCCVNSTTAGVTCNAQGRVSQISIVTPLFLQGSLPLSLSSLTALEVLNLGNQNFLTVSVDAVPLWPLTLRTLILTNIAMGPSSFFDSGSGPSVNVSTLSTLVQLQTLDISGCWMTGFLTAFAPLTRLTFLNAGFNSIQGALHDLSGLTLLTSLNLDFNELIDGTLDPVKQWSALTRLSLSNLAITGTFDALVDATSLTYLVLSNNLFSVDSADMLAQLTLLQVCKLDNQRRLAGSLAFARNMTRLTMLTVNNNRMDGQLHDLAPSCQSLIYLDLSANFFSGSLQALATCTRLQTLYLQGNSLSGAVGYLSQHTALQYLWLYVTTSASASLCVELCVWFSVHATSVFARMHACMFVCVCMCVCVCVSVSVSVW